MRNLRTVYTRELRRSHVNAACRKQPTWEHFKRMSFLHDVVLSVIGKRSLSISSPRTNNLGELSLRNGERTQQHSPISYGKPNYLKRIVGVQNYEDNYTLPLASQRIVHENHQLSSVLDSGTGESRTDNGGAQNNIDQDDIPEEKYSIHINKDPFITMPVEPELLFEVFPEEIASTPNFNNGSSVITSDHRKTPEAQSSMEYSRLKPEVVISTPDVFPKQESVYPVELVQSASLVQPRCHDPLRVSDQDADEMFGRFVVATLKSIQPEFRKDLAKLKIQQVLIKYQHSLDVPLGLPSRSTPETDSA